MFAGFFQRPQHIAPVLRIFHVNEIDNDDAAEIAQAQLARNERRRFEIGAIHSFFQAVGADETAGVHIDGGHRFRLFDHQMAAGFQRYLRFQGAADFVLHAEAIEQADRFVVKFNARHELGQKLRGKGAHFLVGTAFVDTNLSHRGTDQIPSDADVHRQFFVNQRGRNCRALVLDNHLPHTPQEADVRFQFA